MKSKERKNETEKLKYNAWNFNSYPDFYFILFTQPLRSGKIWHKVNF